MIMRKEFLHAFRDKTNLVLFVLDLDHFKNINDTYGHMFGDYVLSSVSATIKKFLRQNDYFIRYGGEEFVMILPQVTLENARDIAERIRMAVESVSLYNTEKDTQVKVTISIGVTTLNGERTLNAAQSLLQNADKALYEAKRTRNRVAVFQAEKEPAAANASTPAG